MTEQQFIEFFIIFSKGDVMILFHIFYTRWKLFGHIQRFTPKPIKYLMRNFYILKQSPQELQNQ